MFLNKTLKNIIIIHIEKNEILSNLCYYDERNPDNILDALYDKDELEAYRTQKTCYCDNCFYRRTPLAEYIIELLNKENGK